MSSPLIKRTVLLKRTVLVRRTLGTTAAMAAAGAVLVGATAAPGESREAAAAKKITAAGVGQVKLGKTHKQLRAAGLVGKLHRGCPLAANSKAADLKPPLEGTVNYSQDSPRRAEDIVVSGGAKARGVGIGSTIADIKAAFPKAKVDRTGEDIFRVTFVNIPKSGGGRLSFAVDVDTKKVTLIGIPFVAVCE
jgi:hypothetical protein